MMLVGHLPHLARLAGLLLAGDPDRPVIAFGQGGLVGLERGPVGVVGVARPAASRRLILGVE
jgi:phosphohistidine phosphatase